jgi:hypothetical protein
VIVAAVLPFLAVPGSLTASCMMGLVAGMKDGRARVVPGSAPASATSPGTITASATKKQSAGPVITRVADYGRGKIIEGRGDYDALLVISLGQVVFTPGAPGNFTMTIECSLLNGGFDCTITNERGNVSHHRDIKFGPMTTERGSIVFREGTLAPEANGSYFIGEFRPEKGEPLPIAVKFLKSKPSPSPQRSVTTKQPTPLPDTNNASATTNLPPPGEKAAPPRASKKSDSGEAYDYRESEAYRHLSPENREKLDQVHHDFLTLWRALDNYADFHNDNPPDSLDQLVPNSFFRELPTDPFATAETARQTNTSNYVTSKHGWGYRYKRGARVPGNQSWCLSSVGLPDFPYLAEKGNVGLYVCKGTWLGGGGNLVLVKQSQQPGKPDAKDAGSNAPPATAVPAQKLSFGPVANGLCAAVELTTSNGVFRLGEPITMRFHIRNASDHEIVVAGRAYRQTDQCILDDEQGNRVDLSMCRRLIRTFTQRGSVGPGEVMVFESGGLSFGEVKAGYLVSYVAKAWPGRYTLRFRLRIPDAGSPDKPWLDDWQGELETGAVTVDVKEPATINQPTPLPGTNTSSATTNLPLAAPAQRLQFRLVAAANDTAPADTLADPGSKEPLRVRKEILLDESAVDHASVAVSPEHGVLVISVEVDFNEAGAKRFAEITGANIGKRLVVVFDGKLLSATTIRSVIRDKAVITGNFTAVEAEVIARALNTQEHFAGIGLVLLADKNHTIRILGVLPYSPASKAGLSPGLVVQKIDGMSTDGKPLRDCADMIRGARGTKVKLELVDQVNSRTNTVELTREKIN